jgi:hypothetical protein
LARAGGPYGADNGWAVDHSSGAVLLTPSVAAQMGKGETGWLRIEMFLVNGHSTWDSTVLGYYDAAVNNARNAGIQVLMLIDGGSWPGGQTAWTQNNQEHNPGANGENAYVGAFATNAVWPIVQHFRDRVKYYEIWNEPNCWNSNYTGGYYYGCTFIYPSNYGWMLARSWEAVHVVHQVSDVTLFFGGVFGHNIGGVTSYANAGAQYVDDTYGTGTNASKGASFNYTKTNYDAYPLDGVGEHVYLSQGGLVASNTFRQYEDWVRQAYTKYEGAGTPKKTSITEFGWTTSSVSQGVQDTNLITSFSAIQATPYVQMAIWFQWADNPAGGMYYGVTNSSSGPKLSYADYQRFERFEGMFADGTTNTGIQNYFNGLGQAALGSPFDNGSGAWVYSFLNGYAQDYDGGAHKKLTVMSSTNGTYELNNLHGLWSYYQTNNGPSAFGFLLDNEFTYGSGTRQDFSRGYLTWDAVNQIVWFPGNMARPTGLAATPSNSVVSLRWNATSGAASYNVKRSTSSGGPYALVANVAATNYTNGSVINGTNYYFVVSGVNSVGESSNSVAVGALPVGPPVLLSQPLSQTVDQDTGVTLGVTAASPVPVSYQWMLNRISLAGATTNPLVLLNLQPADAGNYSVLVSNYGGTAISSNALVAVRPRLALDGQGVLHWSGSFTLQATTNVAGPYEDVPGAASPYTNSLALPLEFFRLRK